MNDLVDEKGYFIPVQRKLESSIENLADNLSREYKQMVCSLLNDPLSIENFKPLLQKILEPLVRNTGELLISKGGREIYFAYQGRTLTDFGAIPLSVWQIHFLDYVRYDVELLVLGQNMQPKVIRLEAKKIGTKQWIEDLGIGYLYEEKGIGRIKNIVKMLSKYAPVKVEYQYCGWIPGKNNSFIFNGKILRSQDGDKDKAKKVCNYTLSMLDVAQHNLTIPLLSIELLSLVHTRMTEMRIFFKGVCCVVAPTQSFKTTIASLFFDCNRGLEANVNFEATTAAIVRTIANTRDSTVICDDFKPGATKTERNEMVRKLSTIIRMCSDDSGGIQKANVQNSVNANVAQSLVVVTAEQMQLTVQSTLARLLILEANRGTVDKTKLSYFQANHNNYRSFIMCYILYIQEQGIGNFCSNLSKRFLAERNTLRDKLLADEILVDNRTSDMCTWLYISFLGFLEFALKIKAIEKEKYDIYAVESYQIFLDLMKQQAERVSELDDVRQFFKALQVLLETGEVCIEELQPRNSSYATMDCESAIGFSKKGFIYLKNGAAFQKVTSYYKRFGKELIANESEFRKRMANCNYINAKNKGTYIHRLFVNHKTYQCIQFQKKTFFKLLYGGKDGAEDSQEVPGNRGLYNNADNILGRRM